ncbi:mis6 domain-containing protein [Sarocladium implicatum]|nr:mis6 domain-containing protein [Sarocladium implicatum]
MAPSSDREITNLIQDVIDASKRPPKARHTSIKPTVASLVSLAYDRGLLPGALDDLVDLVTTPNHLDQASLASIVRNLYPVSSVSRKVVLRVVASLGHGELKPSLNVQAALLRWLILVYHVIETPAVLSQCFQVLFNLLDTAAYRPQLTHLLALITRRKHVRPFRIQTVLGLARQTGNDPCLVGLLRVFKDYYPEIIVGEAVRGKASAFKHPEPSWRERLDEIQDAHLLKSQDGQPQPRDGFRVHRPVNRFRRSKLVPIVQTSHAAEDSVTLEEVESATGLAQNLDKIELPNQLVAVLADPLLQKLLILRPSAESDQRIANWLNAVLEDVIQGDADQDSLWEVLDILKQYVSHTKTLPAIVLNFFARFLPLWDGQGVPGTILDILSFSPFHDFQELHEHIFRPLETALSGLAQPVQLQLFDMYSNLLRHWTTVLQIDDSVPDFASGSISLLVSHVNKLALQLAQTSPDVGTACAILSFYEQTVRLVTADKLRNYIRIELPNKLLVYILFFSDSLVVMSRVCNVLASLKRGFETAMSTKRDGSGRIDSRTYDRSYVDLYNGFLMDICNCLWRTRAFGDSPNAHGCLVPRSTVEALTAYVPKVDKSFSLAMIFGLSHSPVICLQSILRVREAEDEALASGRTIRIRHAGPVTQMSLTKLATGGGLQLGWQDYRIGVLEALTEKDLPGVAELLKNTMTVLKTSMEGRTPGSQTSTQMSTV